MNLQDEIAAIKDSLARAEADRDIWRAAGVKDKYVEAFFKVEALELQLDAYLGDTRTLKDPDRI